MPEFDEYIINLTSEEELIILEIPPDDPVTLEVITGDVTLDQTISTISKAAGENLGGNRVVVINDSDKAIYADKDIPNHIGKILGVTKRAAEEETEVEIQTYGEMIEPSWNWTLDNPIFLNTGGLLTQAVPTSGFLCEVAFPISQTKIFIKIKPSIKLT